MSAVSSKEKEENDLETLREFVKENYWKVRECNDYVVEHSQCQSLKGRFHQYFVFGEYVDCNKWRDDRKNCLDALDDVEKGASIIRHEDERLENRMKNHLANDVWERRKSPPENWNSELPEYMKKNQEAFSIFFKEEPEKSSCVIF